MGGISISSGSSKNLWKITEHINTDTGFKNVTYNHSLHSKVLQIS